MMFHAGIVEQFAGFFIKNIVNFILKNGILGTQNAVF